jgi:hypothetical protein
MHYRMVGEMRNDTKKLLDFEHRAFRVETFV